MAHLEERSTDKEEGIHGEDPDGIKGVTEEFIVHLARAVKNAQQMKKQCYHCDSPDHFICNCQWLAGMKAYVPLNQKEGMVQRNGGWATQRKTAMPKVSQDGMPKV